MTRVGLKRCETYDRAMVYEAVKSSVDLIGGMRKFITPGMGVLIKPNLLSAHKPDEGVTTHPEVVRSVIRLVKECGGEATLGDAPGGFIKNYDEVYESTGMTQLCQEEGVKLVKFTTSNPVNGIPIVSHIKDAQCVISIPKFKTHAVTTITGAIKNTYGMVVGLYKAERHSDAPDEKRFSRVIADVFAAAKPHLTIVDGIMAMEGNGPSGGVLRPMNIVMAGIDACAIDACFAHLIGLKPMDIQTTREVYSRGQGEADLANIEILGDRLSDFYVKDFKLPQTKSKLIRFIPDIAISLLFPLIRFLPYIDPKLCKKCAICQKSCPVKAIEVIDGDFTVNKKKCIKCMCCHEMCPYKAIEIRRNILAKMIWG